MSRRQLDATRARSACSMAWAGSAQLRRLGREQRDSGSGLRADLSAGHKGGGPILNLGLEIRDPRDPQRQWSPVVRRIWLALYSPGSGRPSQRCRLNDSEKNA